MVSAAVTGLKIDLTPMMQQGKGSPSPKLSQAFLHSTDTSWVPSPKALEATLQSELRWSCCPSPLRPLSPSSPSLRAKASPRGTAVAMGGAAFVPNFYEILGLPQDVGLPDIKAAYRQMARQYHPDVCAKEKAEESTRRFIAVQEAYETLSDPRRKASYDRGLPLTLASSAWGWPIDEKDSHGNWRLHWQDQLLNMKMRNDGNSANGPDTWGTRMRRHQKQQESRACEFA